MRYAADDDRFRFAVIYAKYRKLCRRRGPSCFSSFAGDGALAGAFCETMTAAK